MTKIVEVTKIPAAIGYDEGRVIEEFAKDQPKDELLQGLAQADPFGIDQHAPGSKLDAGKTDVGLLWESFPNALMGVAMVATFGANKYTRNGWKDVPQGKQRYAAAEGRHKLERFKGFVNDDESGLPHQFHEVWNALAQLELWYTGKGN